MDFVYWVRFPIASPGKSVRVVREKSLFVSETRQLA